MLDQRHSLFKLAGKIDWPVFDECYGLVYAEVGRPGIPTRLMVGLHYLNMQLLIEQKKEALRNVA